MLNSLSTIRKVLVEKKLDYLQQVSEIVLTGGNMIKPHVLMVDELREFSSPKAKITRLLKKRDLIQVKRGLFLSAEDKGYSLLSISAIIFGPSYVSFASALSYHGFIPERVTGITCATYGKNKNREFHTPIGDFYYHYLPAAVYPYEVVIKEENGQKFLIATAEKALCDSLYKIKGINSIGEIEELIISDWRLDTEALANLDIEVIGFLVPLYRRRICRLFLEWFSKRREK